MIFTAREQSQRATEDALERDDRWRRWKKYTTMDLKNFRQGGEYEKQVVENFKRKGNSNGQRVEKGM